MGVLTYTVGFEVRARVMLEVREENPAVFKEDRLKLQLYINWIVTLRAELKFIHSIHIYCL